MARYSSNFGNKLQMMVGIGKECGFTSNFNMPRSFTLRKSELRPEMANSQSDCRTASCIPPRVEVEQRTHSGDEIDHFQDFYSGTGYHYSITSSMTGSITDSAT